MNKNFFIALFVIISLLYVFNINSYVLDKVTNISNNIKSKYIDTIVNSSNFISKYFNQATIINELLEENKELKQYKILYETTVTELENISHLFNWSIVNEPSLKLTKVISYKQPTDFTQVWIDYNLQDENKIVGLILDQYAAGIALKSDNKTLALLNGNEKANYGVLIGDEKATGITHEINKDGNILIKYIPLWQNFKVGDIVTTSGMDGIFLEGLLVGEIVSITEGINTYEAYMKPYASPTKERFLYVCDIVKSTSE
ncbi:rod shape-determining protein MreC [Arcobacter sp. FWKO B]|uniref:rod shape-determining protein MreC n=1 Tax=Arcobacter sp. FWKO B TaxID=2593672 RepID=UPI0018A53119|nr:rod shape-determining protein MreC [Arcobacter sp. FWKO B]QOG12219.1 rod shape-determining protein MreC [Arcobacter sp. FWKO B]